MKSIRAVNSRRSHITWISIRIHNHKIGMHIRTSMASTRRVAVSRAAARVAPAKFIMYGDHFTVTDVGEQWAGAGGTLLGSVIDKVRAKRRAVDLISAMPEWKHPFYVILNGSLERILQRIAGYIANCAVLLLSSDVLEQKVSLLVQSVPPRLENRIFRLYLARFDLNIVINMRAAWNHLSGGHGKRKNPGGEDSSVYDDLSRE